MEGAGAGSEAAQLTWPSVLSFLQHDYRRFELERSEHALEVASLKLRISTLEAERAQQEKHKLDLQKRVKMLEHVLDAERKKHTGSAATPAASTDSAGSVLPASTSLSTANGTSEAPAARASTSISPSDLSAAKRKSVLKAYVERFERLESLFVLPDLPPLSIPVPVPEVVTVQPVDIMPRGAVREAVFSPKPAATARVVQDSNELKPPDSPIAGHGSSSPATPSSPSSPAREAPSSPTIGRSSASAGAADSAEYRKWNLRGALRGHLDEVTDIAWHPSLPMLVSASADCTLKCWNIAAIYRKTDKPIRTEDFDAMHTYRGHSDQVLAAAFANDNSCILSGSADSLIMTWSLPPIPAPEDAPYLARGAGKKLEGHTDAVWDIAAHPSANVCISASADGTVKIWKYTESKPLVSSLVHPQSKLGRHTPTSVEVMKTDNRKLLVGYTSGTVVVFDMQTEKALAQISDSPQAIHAPERQVNQVTSHSESKSLIFTAHEDKVVKYWDANAGRCVYTLTAHEDAVTSVALDPHSTRHFATVSHDASLRFWNLAARSCTQEVPSVGLKKSDMALHSVSLSPFKLPLAAVACADSSVKLYT